MTKALKNKKMISLFFAAIMLITSFLLPVMQNVSDAAGTGTFTIHKYRPMTSAETDGTSDGQVYPEDTFEGKIPVQNVGFKVKKTHDIVVKGTGESRYIDSVTEVANPTETIYYTNAQGKIVLSNIDYGRYEFTELMESEYPAGQTKPTGIVFPTESKTYTIELPGTKKEDGRTLFDDVHAYPKNQDNVAGLRVSKKGTDAKSGNSIVLPGAKFRIYTDANATNEVVNRPSDNQPYTLPFETGADGTVMIEGLESGKTYYVKEVEAPAGYAINDRTPKAITMNDASTQTQTLEFDNTKLVKEVKTENPGDNISTEKELTYSIYTTVPSDIQDLSSFTIKDNLQQVDGNHVAFIKTGSLKYFLDVDEGDIEDSERTIIPSGIVQWVNAPVSGNYNEAPAGTQQVGFSVDLKDPLIASSPDNGKDINTLAGKRIRIDYTVILTDAAVSKDVTNKMEQIVPDNFTNQDSTADVSNTVTGTKSKLILTKLDMETQLALASAKFQLQKKVGEDWVDVSTVQTTDFAGKIEWDNLGEGTYKLVEVEPPKYNDNGVLKPYIITEKEIEVIIENTDLTENKEITVNNRKAKWYLPATGGFGYYAFTVVSIVLIAIGLGIFGYKKKKVNA